MDAIASVTSAGISRAQFQMQYQAAVMARQQAVARGIGEAAVKLIQTAVASPDTGATIDITA